MTDPSPPAITPPKRRKRFGLSLRVLMVLVLLLGVSMGWYAYRARVQREAVAAIEVAGGGVTYDFEENFVNPLLPAPKLSWTKQRVMQLLGPDYVGQVACVHLENSGESVDNHLMEQVGRLRLLRVLHLDRSTISDAGLSYISGLSELSEIDLGWTSISDAGLPHLYRLANCREINLIGTRTTVEGANALRRRLPPARIYDASEEGTLR